jgi:hypothetical protein
VVKERGFLSSRRRTLDILGHHSRDKVLLLPSVITRISHGVDNHNAGVRDLLDLLGGKQLGQVKSIWSWTIGRGKWLKGEMRVLEPRGLRSEMGTGNWRVVTVPLRCTFAGGGPVRASHDNLFFAGMIWQCRVPLKAFSSLLHGIYTGGGVLFGSTAERRILGDGQFRQVPPTGSL